MGMAQNKTETETNGKRISYINATRYINDNVWRHMVETNNGEKRKALGNEDYRE
jgi:hypothetical protein